MEGDIYVRYYLVFGIIVMVLCVVNVSILFIVINMYMYIFVCDILECFCC